MKDQIHVCNDPESLAAYARDWLIRLIEWKQRDEELHGPFVLALAGGSTPKRLMELLAEVPADRLDWKNIILLWGDERNVAIDDPQSNYRMVRESLLDKIDIPAENILAVPNPGGPADAAAKAYEKLLREKLGGKGEFPVVDCVLLGMGDDVHTASLFPGTKALGENKRLAVANLVPKLDTQRITLTAPMINAARNVAFLINGGGKQDALARLWHAPRDPQKYPAQLVRPTEGQLWFLLDKAALGDTPLPESVMVQMI